MLVQVLAAARSTAQQMVRPSATFVFASSPKLAVLAEFLQFVRDSCVLRVFCASAPQGQKCFIEVGPFLIMTGILIACDTAAQLLLKRLKGHLHGAHCVTLHPVPRAGQELWGPSRNLHGHGPDCPRTPIVDF